MRTNQDIIETSLNRINDIEVLINELHKLNKDAFDGNIYLSKEFKSISKLIKSTKEKLINPMLSLALIGTTSAGKSTIVNALSGRRVAPMEAQETSAGILRLRPSNTINIDIKQTSKAHWDTGITHGVTDSYVYDTLKKIYAEYRKFEKTAQAPDITVTGPLLLQSERDLLSLPDNISVELIDLPGLKNIKDVANLKVIQRALSKSLCVIAIDFHDVDDSRIQRLLEEVKDIVKISGNPESLLFLLNKVDSIKIEDIQLDERIDAYKHLITQGLQLPPNADIKIVPFIGILLYRLQMCLKFDDNMQIVSYDTQNLKDLFDDCASVFRRSLLTNEEYHLIRSIEDKIYGDEEVSIDELKSFYQLCLRLSHANELFQELQHRLDFSFTDIIVRPAVSELFSHIDELMSSLSTYVSINKKNTAQDLICERIEILKMRLFLLGASSDDNIQSARKELNDIFGAINSIEVGADDDSANVIRRMRRDLRNIDSLIRDNKLGYIDLQLQDISKSVTDIAKNLTGLKDSEDVNSYLNSIKDTNRAVCVYNGISGIPSMIKKRLETEVLTPFRSSIENKKSRGEFIEFMSKTNPTVYGESISSNYAALFDLFYSQFTSFTLNDLSYDLKTQNEKSKEWENSTTQVYESLDVRMRDILSKKTNVYFQLDTTNFAKSLNHYLEKELSVILEELKKRLPYTDSDLSLMIDNLMKVARPEIELPDTLFEFATPQGTTHTSKYECVGQTIDYYEHHSCKEDRPVYKNVYGNNYYYKYDNAKGVYRRWDTGIDKSLPVFWTIISYWIIDCVNAHMTDIKNSSLQVANMANSFLAERNISIQNINTSNIEQLDRIVEKLEEIRSVKEFYFT